MVYFAIVAVTIMRVERERKSALVQKREGDHAGTKGPGTAALPLDH